MMLRKEGLERGSKREDGKEAQEGHKPKLQAGRMLTFSLTACPSVSLSFG